MEPKIPFFTIKCKYRSDQQLFQVLPNHCLPSNSDSKISACNAGDLGLIPRLGRSPEKWNGNPFQYSSLENSMDRGAWQATVHRVTKRQTGLSDFHFHCQPSLNTHSLFSSIRHYFAWKISCTTANFFC